MMGHTHALSGAVIWLGAAPFISQHAHHLTPMTVAVGTVVAAGAAMLPDLDHHSGTIANAYGPLSKGLCRLVAFISGGHRHATHSLLGAATFVALTTTATHNAWAVTAVVWLCMGIGVRALWGKRKNRPNGRLDWRDFAGLAHAIVAAFFAWRIVQASGFGPTFVPWAVAVGYLTHLVGDSMTEQGVNWLWPYRRCYRIASIDTGKGVEKWAVVPALYVALGFIAWRGYDTWAPALMHTINPAR